MKDWKAPKVGIKNWKFVLDFDQYKKIMQNNNIFYVLSVFILLALGWLGYVIFQGDEVQTTAKIKASENLNTSVTVQTEAEEAQKQNNPTESVVLKNNLTTESKKTENKNMNQKQEAYKITMETNYGTIVLELDGKKAPNTAYNFAQIARMGGYDGTKFHRVIKGFMIQGGDPLTKDDTKQNFWGTGGTGWDGKKFADENSGLSNKIGTISMANAGPNTNGSQFFINTADNTFLDGRHTVFGRVVTGMDVVVKIESVKTLLPGQLDRPEQSVIVKSVVVE